MTEEHSLGDSGDSAEHRSGAWKVAYADFVTALMALFIVLWLMNASREVRDAVSSYFRSPKGHAGLSGSAHAGSGAGLSVDAANVGNLKERLEKVVRETPALQRIARHVHFTIAGEGLRIELTEGSGGVFFESASPQPTEYGDRLFRLLAQELGRLPNELTLEGHTDSKSFRGVAADAYGNWELSFDRANMARRIMLAGGLRPDQIAEIRGFADKRPLTGDASDSRNRRISVVVRFAEEPKSGD